MTLRHTESAHCPIFGATILAVRVKNANEISRTDTIQKRVQRNTVAKCPNIGICSMLGSLGGMQDMAGQGWQGKQWVP